MTNLPINPDPESFSWARLLLATTTVAGLMALFVGGLKYMAARGWAPAMPRNGARRLKVIESLPLDARRRLVIIRCDQEEHLLLLGVNGEQVVSRASLSRNETEREHS